MPLLPSALNLPRTALSSNFFTPAFSQGLQIHIYSLHFTPELASDNRLKRKQVITASRERIRDLVGGHVLSGENLFALRELREGSVLPCGEFTLRLQLVRTVPMGQAQGQLEVQLVLNVILKRAMRELGLMQLTQLPRFYTPNPTALPNFRLEIWRGYAAELVFRETCFYVNIDFSSKITHTQSLHQAIQDFRSQFKGRDWVSALRVQFKGRTVITNYGNRKCYRIEELCMDKTPSHSFECRGAPVTFMAYYQTQYNLLIRDPDQPLVRCLVKSAPGEVYLVPELVSLTGLDEAMRADYRLMSAIAEFTRLEPQDRLSTSISLPRKCSQNAAVQQLFRDFAFSLSPEPVEVQSYQLPRVGVGAQTKFVVSAEGNFSMRGKVQRAVAMERWVVMAGDRDMEAGKRLAQGLQERLEAIGDTVAPPEVKLYSKELFLRAIAASDRPAFIVILLHKSQKADYNAIKQASVLTHPVLTQVVMGPINDRRYASILDKLALQIQAKAGGLLWSVSCPGGFGKYVMVVGLDVYHDTIDRKKSAVGFCATIHPQFAQYYNSAVLQTSGQEIALTIGCLLQEALAVFRERARGYLPDSIVFFRDGVAESQVDCVKRMEVESVLKACEDFEANYSPQVIYTLVVKRIGTRFFTKQAKAGNPAIGTLVTALCEPGCFYLLAHSTRQGVAAPTLYRTVHAVRPFDLEKLASLAYALCHLYYNWTGAIKVPAPCMLAHKLAYLVGQSVHSAQIRQEMKTHAFYL